MAYKLFYHSKCEGFYGRGMVPLAMLKHSGVEFSIHAPDEVPAGAGFAVPMVTFPDGSTTAQTVAVIVALGESLGLAPESPASKAKAMQLVLDGIDIGTEMSSGKPVDRIQKWMDYFEMALGESDYFVDGSLTYVDFALWGVFDVIPAKKALGKFEGYVMGSRLTAWYEKMCSVGAIAEMKGTGIPYLPPSMM